MYMGVNIKIEVTNFGNDSTEIPEGNIQVTE